MNPYRATLINWMRGSSALHTKNPSTKRKEPRDNVSTFHNFKKYTALELWEANHVQSHDSDDGALVYGGGALPFEAQDTR